MHLAFPLCSQSWPCQWTHQNRENSPSFRKHMLDKPSGVEIAPLWCQRSHVPIYNTSSQALLELPSACVCLLKNSGATRPRSWGQSQDKRCKFTINPKVFPFFLTSVYCLAQKTRVEGETGNQRTQRRGRVRESTAGCCCPLVPNTPSCGGEQPALYQPGVDHKLIKETGVIKQRFADL